ncbi:hypothetical protein SAMN05518672_1011277 [Chitinophaga sp. CF118]|uniref:DUF7009 family protein n=1 Tax=Chitinophaga sp. CF118 TaxID=1884367 RepID=UPI0008E3EAF9|nr:hypothetical protein [Chitinophaga sp. CF118]SFD25214.1 hypothetical protein SAMN05518672_1011277 [Chitinophaga sp. CF118]
MKIRIRGNSIRYRLDKQDIQLLREQQKVEETTTIGAGTLHFCIKSKNSGPAIKLEQSGVHLSLPAEQVKNWVETEEVGFSLELPNSDGSVLQILVEKDFKCLTERDEDESMAFDNPTKSC